MTVELHHIEKTIRGVPVLCDVSAVFPSGCITGLAGVNGSGKTMLMRVMCGLVCQDGGTITRDGLAVRPGSSGQGRIGLLIENPAFLPRRSGFDNLMLLASINKVVDEKRVQKAISSFGLDPNDKRPFSKYSLGMKQRLGLACAFMEQPDLLLLDEPTNALDSNGVELFEAQVTHAAKNGATVVLACHDAQILRGLANQIYYLAEGRVDHHEVLKGGSS